MPIYISVGFQKPTPLFLTLIRHSTNSNRQSKPREHYSRSFIRAPAPLSNTTRVPSQTNINATSDHRTSNTVTSTMTKSTPWTPVQYRLSIDPQPRDPPNGKSYRLSRSPNRPRPEKPPQPRDDGQSRTYHEMFDCISASGKGGSGGTKPQPRDPGNGRLYAYGPQPRDDGSNGLFSSSGKPTKPQPRDPGGKKGRNSTGPTPRDAGQ